MRHQPVLDLLALLAPDARRNILALYKQTLRDEVARLQAAIAAQAADGAAAASHRLAGAAAMMQDQELSHAFRGIEAQLGLGGWPSASAIDGAKALVAETLQWLEALSTP